MNFKKLTSRFLAILSMVVLTITSISCTETETTNTAGFAIYYYSLTDIGPSMSTTIDKPTYTGSAPSDFAITEITLNGEPYSSESFVIDSNDGSIRVINTDNLTVGHYFLSIGCNSNGKFYEFKNAVEINMLPKVPEGIKVEPDYIEIDFTEVDKSTATAKVVTEGEHVSIKNYAIADSPEKDFFKITTSGVISINKENISRMAPGRHMVALKLTTFAGEGIFPDAVTFNLTSKPLGLTYNTTNSDILEAESAETGPTSYTSPVPTIIGSSEEAVFSIESIEPAIDNNKITIDEKTGVISVASGHGLEQDKEYTINIKVSNKYAPEGVVMSGDNAFKLNIVGYITPIENFAYDNIIDHIQYTSISLAPNEGLKGSYITFSFIDLDPKLATQLSINKDNGAIKAKKNNTIPVGTYTIKVQADNGKGEPQIANFTLSVIENPNDIKYIYYGNNLGLDKTKEASQYRVKSAEDLAKLELTPESNLDGTNIPIKYRKVTHRNMANSTVDATTGKVTLSADDFGAKESPLTWIVIEATAGEGEAARTYTTFVAFDHITSDNKGVTIEYTPFVFKVNPKTGGTSVAPKLTGVDATKLVLDYRRTFYYQNINGPKLHKSGAISTDKKDENTGVIVTPADPSYFMNQVWRNYYGSKKVPNYGSKDPMSYYTNINKLGDALGYVDPNKGFAVTINPNKWYGDIELGEEAGQYANGIMSGQMTYVTDGNQTGVNNGSRTFPLLIWFDEKF